MSDTQCVPTNGSEPRRARPGAATCWHNVWGVTGPNYARRKLRDTSKPPPSTAQPSHTRKNTIRSIPRLFLIFGKKLDFNIRKVNCRKDCLCTYWNEKTEIKYYPHIYCMIWLKCKDGPWLGYTYDEGCMKWAYTWAIDEVMVPDWITFTRRNMSDNEIEIQWLLNNIQCLQCQVCVLKYCTNIYL